jgi:hypothetical protein
MRQAVLGMLALVGLATLSLGSASAQPNPLELLITIDESVKDARLGQVIARLGKTYDLTIQVDEAAFMKPVFGAVSAKLVRLPRMADVPLDFVLEMLAQQVGGTVRLEKDRLVIVPGKRELASVLRTAGKEVTENLGGAVRLERAIDGAPLGDVVEYLSDKCELTIVVEDWSFAKAVMHKSVLDTECTLAAGTRPLQHLLELLAVQVGGRVVVGERLVLIAPKSK